MNVFLFFLSACLTFVLSASEQKQTVFRQHESVLVDEDDRMPPSIDYANQTQTFHLKTLKSSYVFFVDEYKRLQHLYWGSVVEVSDDLRHVVDQSFPVTFDTANGENARLFEYSNFGNGDYRIPSYRTTFQDDGTSVSTLEYESHEIYRGVAKEYESHPSIPHFRAQDDTATLVVKLKDPLKQLVVELYYTVFPRQDAITRSVRFRNEGRSLVNLEHVSSVTVDFPPHSHDRPYHMTHLSGSWARERMVESRKVFPGLSGIDSRRGASSPQHNPFILISEGTLAEERGNVYGIGLVYSSSYQMLVEKTHSLSVRVTAGLHPDTFRWRLKPGDDFQSPEAVLVFAEGSRSLSNQLHDLIKSSLLPGADRTHWTPSVPRPIMVNSWEAMYFWCTETRILWELVQPAKDLGIDMVVIDDGWFKNRNNDQRALGDWFPDWKKFPHGLGRLSEKMRGNNIKLGIWMEPEMISKESDLYNNHPDWPLHTNGREMSECRNQLVLDLTRKDVQDFIIESVSRVLHESKASYLKWDFNRHLSQVSSESVDRESQGEVLHRWTLGLYRIWHEVTSAFPEVLFESCSSGGGRFDLGLLYFTPQIWTSDNTDAISRVSIQMGTSLVYPYVSMASHVSAVPNHQVHRSSASFITRHIVAASGTFGYELNLKALRNEEKQVIRQFTQLYREFLQPLILHGKYYRLNELVGERDPDAPQSTSWIFVSPDQTRAAMSVVLTSFHQTVVRPARQVASGLLPNRKYKLEIYREHDSHWGVQKTLELSGKAAMNVGVILTWDHDADSALILFKILP